MTDVWPLKFKDTGKEYLFSDDAGGFFKSDAKFLDRYANGNLAERDLTFLKSNGHAFEEQNDLAWTSFAYRWSRRQAVAGELTYLILVPTLRCNLTCGYCQVSRVSETAQGFDWNEETLEAVLQFLNQLSTSSIKIEFQGGEPLLRLDILEKVRAFCRQRFESAQIVVCTNLQNLTEREWSFLAEDDTFISTSVDGDRKTHQRQRTHEASKTDAFFRNLNEAVRRFPEGKISALPTIDVDNPPDLEALITNFEQFGIRSIYLRPINYQGFARKLKQRGDVLQRWNTLYSDFIDRLVERNFATGSVLEEYYFSQCLKRILRTGSDQHVDLRNPNFFASDYLVIDHDGVFYPTDEARMLSRIGRIDLSIGDLSSGLDSTKIAALNASSLNNFDPDCIHCVYQPFCGTDVVDDLSRYGRIDVPRHETWFCGRHTSIFDKAFKFLYSNDEAIRFSVAHWLGVADWSPQMVEVHT
ncbi:His-Xaa-Ser system radical SAM maturase HxsB [Brucella pseudogrignonensis]|uniref:His-Xaa-Ser system radical SAM maturase HxsB n=1 Tax=Brucella pseudogrignonensis TaxID=419475 RepID=UPI0038B52E62